jgi:AraC-like DNA-binding protein
MFHSRGERRYQRTTAACEWGSVALTAASLSAFGRTLVAQELVAPAAGRIIRPRRADGRRLQRLHAQAGRVVETQLERIAHAEVARALEQDLILALVNCLANGTVQEDGATSRRKNHMFPFLETHLAGQSHRLLPLDEICDALGISGETLRTSCLRALGMSPNRYQRLRRLKLVRSELLRAKAVTQRSVEQIVVHYGFPDLHRFVTEYWQYYGEMPPIPPHDPSEK